LWNCLRIDGEGGEDPSLGTSFAQSRKRKLQRIQLRLHIPVTKGAFVSAGGETAKKTEIRNDEKRKKGKKPVVRKIRTEERGRFLKGTISFRSLGGVFPVLPDRRGVLLGRKKGENFDYNQKKTQFPVSPVAKTLPPKEGRFAYVNRGKGKVL